MQEANAALPEVRRLLVEARAAVAALRQEQQHLDDLRIVYGPDAGSEGNQGVGEWRVHSQRHREAKTRFHQAMQEFADRGIEVKDVESGLIDFYALRGKELVYLCWKEGEGSVRTWHSLQGGFAARKPVGNLVDWRRA